MTTASGAAGGCSSGSGFTGFIRKAEKERFVPEDYNNLLREAEEKINFSHFALSASRFFLIQVCAHLTHTISGLTINDESINWCVFIRIYRSPSTDMNPIPQRTLTPRLFKTKIFFSFFGSTVTGIFVAKCGKNSSRLFSSTFQWPD